MSVAHRREEMAEKLPQMRDFAQSLSELTNNAKMALAQARAWGGVTIEDFPHDPDDPDQVAAAEARLMETNTAMAAVQEIMAAMGQNVVNTTEDITREQAILRVARRS